MSTLKSDNCPDCGAKIGELHRIGCDVEPCPRCGKQLLSCGHYLFGAVEAPPDAERLPWTGEWPGARECREFNWWCKRDPAGPGFVPCAAEDEGAGPDLNRLYKDAVWDRKRKCFVRKEDLGGARLVRHWRLDDVAPEAKTIADVIDGLQTALDEWQKMLDLGVVLSEESDMEDGHAVLVTTEPSVANQFYFELEPEGGGESDTD